MTVHISADAAAEAVTALRIQAVEDHRAGRHVSAGRATAAADEIRAAQRAAIDRLVDQLVGDSDVS